MHAYDEYRRGMGLTRRQVLSVTLAAAGGADIWWALESSVPAEPARTGRSGDQTLPRGPLADARSGSHPSLMPAEGSSTTRDDDRGARRYPLNEEMRS